MKSRILLTLILAIGFFSILSIKSEAKFDTEYKTFYKFDYNKGQSKQNVKVKISKTKPTNKDVKVTIDLSNCDNSITLGKYEEIKELNAETPVDTKKRFLEYSFKKNGFKDIPLFKDGECIGSVLVYIRNIDKQPPEITLDSPRYHKISDGYMVRFSALDDGSGVRYIYYYPSGRKEDLGKGTWGEFGRFDATPGSYKIKAVDNVGNVSVKAFKVSKKDYKNRRKLKKF